MAVRAISSEEHLGVPPATTRVASALTADKDQFLSGGGGPLIGDGNHPVNAIAATAMKALIELASQIEVCDGA